MQPFLTLHTANWVLKVCIICSVLISNWYRYWLTFKAKISHQKERKHHIEYRDSPNCRCAWNHTLKCHFNFALCTYLTVIHHFAACPSVSCVEESWQLWGPSDSCMLTTGRPARKKWCISSQLKLQIVICKQTKTHSWYWDQWTKTTTLFLMNSKFLFHHFQGFTLFTNAFYGLFTRRTSKSCFPFWQFTADALSCISPKSSSGFVGLFPVTI